jgi:hypothetical protein
VAVFCVLSEVLYGGSPVSSGYLPACACGDAAQEVWFLAWPAHALAHALNPLYTNFAAYPRGINLMSSTSMPLLGALASPISLTLSPVASFNLLMRLAPVLSASSLLFVLRRWVRWWPAAFAGALLYGFSPFVFAEGHSHLFLTFLPLPPLLLWLFDELLIRQRRSPRTIGGLLGLAAAAQLLISAEVLALAALMGLLGIVLVAVRHHATLRQRLEVAAPGLAVALLVFLLLAGYPLFMYLAGTQHVGARQHPTVVYHTFYDDLLGAVVPTKYQLIATHGWQATGDSLAQGDLVDHPNYLGVPLLLVLGFLAIRYRRVGIVALSSLLGLAALILTLGPRLHVDGSAYIRFLPLPYDWLLHVPLLNGALAPRFALFMYLAAGIVLAAGLDRLRADSGPRLPLRAPSRFASIACAIVGIAALVPVMPSAAYTRAPLAVPSFFKAGSLIDRRVPAGSVLLPYPNAQEPSTAFVVVPETRSMLWQAAAGMRFRMFGVYAAQPGGSGLGVGDELLVAPKAVQRFLGWALYGGQAVPGGAPTSQLPHLLRLFCLSHHVDAIVVDPTAGVHPRVVVQFLSRALGRPPAHVGGVDGWFAVDRTLGSDTVRK